MSAALARLGLLANCRRRKKVLIFPEIGEMRMEIHSDDAGGKERKENQTPASGWRAQRLFGNNKG